MLLDLLAGAIVVDRLAEAGELRALEVVRAAADVQALGGE